MAAITVTNRRSAVMGSKRVIMASLTGSTTSDTWTTGLKLIQGYTIDGGTGTVPTTTSVSGGVITIGSATALTAASGMAWGY